MLMAFLDRGIHTGTLTRNMFTHTTHLLAPECILMYKRTHDYGFRWSQ